MKIEGIILLVGLVFGMIIGAVLVISVSYNKSALDKILINEDCGEYNRTSGEFILKNLRSKK